MLHTSCRLHSFTLLSSASQSGFSSSLRVFILGGFVPVSKTTTKKQKKQMPLDRGVVRQRKSQNKQALPWKFHFYYQGSQTIWGS